VLVTTPKLVVQFGSVIIWQPRELPGIIELGMVEDIEKFSAHLKPHILPDHGPLRQSISVLLIPGPWKNWRFELPKCPN